VGRTFCSLADFRDGPKIKNDFAKMLKKSQARKQPGVDVKIAIIRDFRQDIHRRISQETKLTKKSFEKN
jgi:hypothetical protein